MYEYIYEEDIAINNGSWGGGGLKLQWCIIGYFILSYSLLLSNTKSIQS